MEARSESKRTGTDSDRGCYTGSSRSMGQEGERMNAKELTEIVNKQSNEIIELNGDVTYLKQEVEKLRMLMDDIKIDIQMLGQMRH